MSSGGGKRWWENYLVRYFTPSIAGVAIVLWLGDIAGEHFQELLLLPKTATDINTLTLILLLLYGNLYCYVASYPILSFHATRVLDFKNSTWSHSHLWHGYIATAVLSLFVLFISLCFHNRLCYGWAFPLAFLFSVVQVARICMVWKSKNGITLVYGYASALAKQRTLSGEAWRQDLLETYRHLREHGNSGFIVLLELALAGLAYWIVVNHELSASQKLSAVGILFAFWAFPAALVHLLAQHLERSFSRYDRWE